MSETNDGFLRRLLFLILRNLLILIVFFAATNASQRNFLTVSFSNSSRTKGERGNEFRVKKILEPSSEAIPEMRGKLFLAILLVFLQTLAVSDSIESTDAKYIFPRGLIKFHRKRRKQWSSRPQTGKSSRWCDAIIYRARIGPKTFE